MLFELYIRQYAKEFALHDRNMWNYEDAIVLIGLEELYEATGDEYWWIPIKAFVDRYVEDDGTIRLYDYKEYNLDKIPGGRVFFTLLEKTGDVKYRKAIEALASQLRNQPRTQCGSFWHKQIYPNQVWLDGLYMGLPFYMLYARLTGRDDIYQDVIKQFKNVRDHLFDDEKHLYYHAWDESRSIFWCDKDTGLSPNFWSRSIGWYLMALADVYGYLPSDRHKERDYIASLWKEAIDGVRPYQDERTGMLYQLTALTTLKENYLETTSTLMYAYSIFKGCLEGVLNADDYAPSALLALMGTESEKLSLDNGHLRLGGMCKGAGLGPDGNYKRDGSVHYYLAEEIVADEQKGAGVAMLAYAEYLKARKAGLITSSLPVVTIYKKKYDPLFPNEPGFRATM